MRANMARLYSPTMLVGSAHLPTVVPCSQMRSPTRSVQRSHVACCAISSSRYHAAMSAPLPYRIAVLAYLFDDQGRLLLLHRRKVPNRHLYSPIGGKLDVDAGESPTACAIREIREEAGIELALADLHLTGMV